jgi:hypothetical protein
MLPAMTPGTPPPPGPPLAEGLPALTWGSRPGDVLVAVESPNLSIERRGTGYALLDANLPTAARSLYEAPCIWEVKHQAAEYVLEALTPRR